MPTAGEGRKVLTVHGGPMEEVTTLMLELKPLLDRLYPGAVLRMGAAGFEVWGTVDQAALNGDEPDDEEDDG